MSFRSLMRASAVAALVYASTVAMSGAVSAQGQGDLAATRRATARYHDVDVAEAAGYEEFLSCFDSPEGGMGQHYVQFPLDDRVDALHPEAMVYEKTDRGLHLAAVEWIVPDSPEVAANPPEMFGQHFHLEASLGVWVLHAWIWRTNPAGMFADWNPQVTSCPGSET